MNLLKLGLLSVGTIIVGFSQHRHQGLQRDRESSLSIDTARVHKIKRFCPIKMWIFTKT